jgi:hypothetical protein
MGARSALANIPAPGAEEAPKRQASAAMRWYARANLGLGPMFGSAQHELLDADGYGDTLRWWLLLEGTWLLSKYAGVGAWAGGNYRSADAPLDSPRSRR